MEVCTIEKRTLQVLHGTPCHLIFLLHRLGVLQHRTHTEGLLTRKITNPKTSTFTRQYKNTNTHVRSVIRIGDPSWAVNVLYTPKPDSGHLALCGRSLLQNVARHGLSPATPHTSKRGWPLVWTEGHAVLDRSDLTSKRYMKIQEGSFFTCS
jgi:hypothetical protein